MLPNRPVISKAGWLGRKGSMAIHVLFMLALSFHSAGGFDDDNRIRTKIHNPHADRFHVINAPATHISTYPSLIRPPGASHEYRDAEGVAKPRERPMTYGDASQGLEVNDRDNKHPTGKHSKSYDNRSSKTMKRYKLDKLVSVNMENEVVYSADTALAHAGDELSRADQAINPKGSMWIKPALNSSQAISRHSLSVTSLKPAVDDPGGPSSSPDKQGGTGHFHIPHFGIMEPGGYPRRSPVRSEHSVEGTFLWAVGLFGTVENGAILLTAIFSRKFKRPLHMLVGSLAATDLFISLIYIPSYTYFLLGGDRDFTVEDSQTISYTYCTISRGIFVEVASVTVTIKAMIALYLYIFTISKESAKRIFTTKSTLCYIFLAYLINFAVLFIPLFIGYSMVDLYPNALVCSVGPDAQYSMWENEKAIALYSLAALALHVAELTVICVCFVYLHRAIAQGSAYSDKHRENDKEARMNYRRASKLTLVVFISFCVCWLPIYLVSILDPDRSLLPNQLHRFAMDLLLLKSSVNPTIYICAMRSLRHELRLMCICKCRSRSGDKIIRAAKAAIHRGSSSVTRSFDTSSAGV